jgi:Protein of unknown function (DUF1214)
VTLYDHETCSFIRDVNRVGLDSYDQKMHRNNDGSVDIYFGPKPPTGQDANWIPTMPSREYFPWFRFYGPETCIYITHLCSASNLTASNSIGCASSQKCAKGLRGWAAEIASQIESSPESQAACNCHLGQVGLAVRSAVPYTTTIVHL